MKIIRHKKADAVFQFTLEDFIEALKSNASEDGAKELMDFLQLQVGDLGEIRQGKRPFLYAILDLLASNKANVFCKTCVREYQAKELICFPVGAGENPLEVKMGYRESLLKRVLGRQKRVPLVGGKGYKCPEAHRLFRVVTWRT